MTTFSVNFLHIPIWVEVWGLPFDFINEEAGRDIGSGIGRVVVVDDCKAITSDQARFLRIRVEMLWINQSGEVHQSLVQKWIEYGLPFNMNAFWGSASIVDF